MSNLFIIVSIFAAICFCVLIVFDFVQSLGGETWLLMTIPLWIVGLYNSVALIFKINERSKLK